MLPSLPAALGIPGGIELIVIFFVMFLLFGVPVALALLLGYRYVRGQTTTGDTEERIDELESELAELRNAVEADTPTDTPMDTPTDRRSDSPTTGEVRDDE